MTTSATPSARRRAETSHRSRLAAADDVIAPNDFVHLHTHSEFSLLDGLGRITDLVDTSVKHGFDSLAITDHGALYGSVAFYQAATKAGIKPIIGMETYVARQGSPGRRPTNVGVHRHLSATRRSG